MRRDFSKNLLQWLENNPRRLVWKIDKDAYSTWLSEIIMQQTRVEYGSQYYIKFKQLYPTIFHLADENQQDVLKAWEGLGYYSRARNLHETAKHIAYERQGKFPDTFKGLLKLKGVGNYTAAAILSFVHNKPKAAIDGNAYRVLARYFGISTPIDSTIGKKEFQLLGDQLIALSENPAKFNQAVMNLGAMVCTPKQPTCTNCPLKGNCIAKKLDNQHLYPTKSKKTKRKKRYFHFYILTQNEHTYIQERTDKDIWQNLFQFPMVETNKKENWTHTIHQSCLGKTNPEQYQIKQTRHEKKQLLSHQEIFATFIKIELKEPILVPSCKKIKISALKNYPFPLVINNFLKKGLT